MTMTFDERLNCSKSYATEDSPHLICQIDGHICDGTIQDKCLWGKSFTEEMEFFSSRSKDL